MKPGENDGVFHDKMTSLCRLPGPTPPPAEGDRGTGRAGAVWHSRMKRKCKCQMLMRFQTAKEDLKRNGASQCRGTDFL